MKKFSKIAAVVMACLITISIPTKAFAAGEVYLANSDSPVDSITSAVVTSIPGSKFFEDNVSMITVTNDAEKTITIPLIVKQDGCLSYSLITENSAAGTFTYTISSDAEKNNVIISDSSELTDTTGFNNMKSLKKGTYYLTIDVVSEDTTAPAFIFGFSSFLYSNSAKTLKNGEAVVSAKGSSADYHKFTLTKSAFVGLEGETMAGSSSLKFTVCNSKKKAITKQMDMTNSNAPTFSLAKGTYYLKVTTNSPVYVMSYSAKAVNEKSNSSSKPANLKVNTQTLGLITSNDAKNKTDYYKVTPTKDGQLKGIYVSYSGQGSLKLKIKAPGMKEKVATVKSGMYMEYSISETMKQSGQTFYRNGQFAKGTYTIQIVKPNDSTSGVYEIGTMSYK